MRSERPAGECVAELGGGDGDALFFSLLVYASCDRMECSAQPLQTYMHGGVQVDACGCGTLTAEGEKHIAGENKRAKKAESGFLV